MENSETSEARPLRVLINATPAKMSGLLTYVLNFALSLSRHGTPHTYIFYVPPEHVRRFADMPPNFDVRPNPASHWFFLGRFAWDQFALRRILKRENVDVLVSINFALHASPCPQALWIQNALYFSPLHFRVLRRQRAWREYMRMRFRRWLTRAAVRSADMLLFPTEALRREVLKQWPWIKQPSAAAPYGWKLPGFATDGACPDHVLHRLETMRRSGKVLHYPSLLNTHKDLPTVLRAFERVLREEPDCWLLLTPDFDVAPMLTPAIRDRVVWFRTLPYGCVPSLYKASDIVLFSSYCESFGFPLIEAMSYSLPIVAADIPTTRELCGQVARYVPVFDDEAMAREVVALLRDEKARKQLGAAGRAQAEEFQWEEHLGIVLGNLEKIAYHGEA
jgi:glycosyltransferase involved in cell wall biosynthesis